MVGEFPVDNLTASDVMQMSDSVSETHVTPFWPSSCRPLPLTNLRRRNLVKSVTSMAVSSLCDNGDSSCEFHR